MQNFIIRITQENTDLLKVSSLSCFILPSGFPVEFLKNFTKFAQKENKLVLFSGEDALSSYEKYQGDGFILDVSAKEFKPKELIQIIRSHSCAFIGVVCRNRRHEAMLVSECEPAFVIFRVWKDGFAENKKLLDWYNELFLIQSAAQIEDNDISLSDLKTDFLILSDLQYKIFVAK